MKDIAPFALIEERAGCRIQRDADLFPGLVARQFDRLKDHFDGLNVGLQRRREAAFIANRRVVAALLQHALQRVEHLGTPAQRVGKALRPHRHHHELLEVHVVIRMRAAVEDVHHRRRQDACIYATQIAVERHAKRLGSRTRTGHRNSQNGIRAQPALVFRPVERQHGRIDQSLIASVQPFELRSDDALHVLHSLQHTLAEIVLLVAITQFHRLVLARGGTAWDGRAPASAVLQDHVGFNRRVATAVQDLPCLDGDNLNHLLLLPSVVPAFGPVAGNPVM